MSTYLVADSARRVAWRADVKLFSLLKYLAKPRDINQVLSYWATSQAEAVADESELTDLLQFLQRVGIVEEVDASARTIDCSHTEVAVVDSRYSPARTPVTAFVKMPMLHSKLLRVMQELEQAGVLSVVLDARGESSSAIAGIKKSEGGNRAAIDLRLQLSELSGEDKEDGDWAAALSDAGLVNSVQLYAGVGEVEQVVQRLKDLPIPYSVVYSLQRSESAAQLTRVAEKVLTAGARYIQFNIDDANIDSTNDAQLSTVGQSIRLAQDIQERFSPEYVRIVAPNLPLPQTTPIMQPTLLQLFSECRGECVVGQVMGRVGEGAQAAGVGVLSPENEDVIGLMLPPNCCQAGMTHLAIDKDGDVYPCEKAFGVPELVMGNLFSTALNEIWANENWEFFRGRWDLYQLQGCYGCNLYINCYCRRCRVQALKGVGNRFAPMPLCVQCAGELGLKRENLSKVGVGPS